LGFGSSQIIDWLEPIHPIALDPFLEVLTGMKPIIEKIRTKNRDRKSEGIIEKGHSNDSFRNLDTGHRPLRKQKMNLKCVKCFFIFSKSSTFVL